MTTRKTPIEWTDETWNPVRGCTPISPGCANCYAMRTAYRFSAPGKTFDGLVRLRRKGGPVWTGDVRPANEKTLRAPLAWRTPKRVFVNSMSDLFHEGFSDEVISDVFAVMLIALTCEDAPRHTFQVLTKRAARMREYLSSESTLGLVAEAAARVMGNQEWGDAIYHLGTTSHPGIHLGVSVEDQRHADERLPYLLATPAAVRIVSYEPALGPVDFEDYLWERGTETGGPTGFVRSAPPLDWVIVGGESGYGARAFELGWGRSVVQQCRDAKVACFFKQVGRNAFDDGKRFKTMHPKGGDMAEWPSELRVREWPRVSRVAA